MDDKGPHNRNAAREDPFGDEYATSTKGAPASTDTADRIFNVDIKVRADISHASTGGTGPLT